jgi:hypothetical protein
MTPPLAHRIKAIHPFGPQPGEYVREQGTVPETFKRARNQQQAAVLRAVICAANRPAARR